MTPEEIVNKLLSEVVPSYEDIYYQSERQQAIEAIKQLCREMCDKQKQECVNLIGKETGS